MANRATRVTKVPLQKMLVTGMVNDVLMEHYGLRMPALFHGSVQGLGIFVPNENRPGLQFSRSHLKDLGEAYDQVRMFEFEGAVILDGDEAKGFTANCFVWLDDVHPRAASVSLVMKKPEKVYWYSFYHILIDDKARLSRRVAIAPDSPNTR